jgi:hypothetical protein
VNLGELSDIFPAACMIAKNFSTGSY